MCGIAGVIHRNGNSKIGEEMSSMLQAMKHRGPDSTGFALYCERDKKDSSRVISPLVPAEDAIVIDSSNIGINELKEMVLKLIRS